MNLDLLNGPKDKSQRLLNAIEPGTVMPIHRHYASSETVVILRGKIRWIFYYEKGNEAERVSLDVDGWPRMLNVERIGGTRWGAREAGACCLGVRMGDISCWGRDVF